MLMRPEVTASGNRCQALFRGVFHKKRKSAARAKTKKANKRIYNNKNNNKKNNEDKDYDKDYDEDKEKGQRGAALQFRGTTHVTPARDQKSIFSQINPQNLACRTGKATPGPNSGVEISSGVEREGKETRWPGQSWSRFHYRSASGVF
jgi:hypothetical protein